MTISKSESYVCLKKEATEICSKVIYLITKIVQADMQMDNWELPWSITNIIEIPEDKEKQIKDYVLGLSGISVIKKKMNAA